MVRESKLGQRECPYCDDPPYISFNWPYAINDSNDKLHFMAKQLDLMESLKFGFLYSCGLCGQRWYLDDAEMLMSRIPDDKYSLLMEWNERDLTPTESQRVTLDSIGGTEADFYGNGRGLIRIPCLATIGDQIIDPAIVLISKTPPIQNYLVNIKLFKSGTVIQATDFALSIEVRIATINAEEMRNGFSPTVVQAIQGRNFILNGTCDLFSYGDVLGCDIQLSKNLRSWRECSGQYYSLSDFNFATYLFADWFEGCEQLIRS